MNVVVILVDALRFDRILDNHLPELTPNIRRLADDGVSFTSAYSVSNATDVAVTSLQTGHHPLSHGILNHGDRVTDSEKKVVEQVPNLAEILKNEGYVTAKFGRPLGRWHRNGFDVYPDFDLHKSRISILQNMMNNILRNLGAKLRSVDYELYEFARRKYNKLRKGAKTKFKSKYSGRPTSANDDLTEFNEFIKNNTRFFSYVHLMDTHVPYECEYDTVVDILRSGQHFPKRHPGENKGHPYDFDVWIAKNHPSLVDEYYYANHRPSTAVSDAHYDAAVQSADERVGKIIDILKNEGKYDDSLIFFLSDHGESLNEHGIYYDHHGLYEVSVKIPLIVKPPNPLISGIEIDELVQITDIVPTVADYANIEIKSQGFSLRPNIDGEIGPCRDGLLIEERHTQSRRCILTENYKLIYDLDNKQICRYCGVRHAPETELYNIYSDPHELTNLAYSEPDKVRNLKKQAEKMAENYLNQKPSPRNSVGISYRDEEVLKDRLRQLGYK
jgi:arylsulfatase A-like enzyme